MFRLRRKAKSEHLRKEAQTIILRAIKLRRGGDVAGAYELIQGHRPELQSAIESIFEEVSKRTSLSDESDSSFRAGLKVFL